jgi:hypothetical protein
MEIAIPNLPIEIDYSKSGERQQINEQVIEKSQMELYQIQRNKLIDWLEKKFLSVKQEYNETSDTFFISNAVHGIHLGIFQKYKNLKFSEFLVGNEKDINTVLDWYYNKNIFKSFYCSTCTIEEEDNFSILEDGKLSRQINLAEEKQNYKLDIVNNDGRKISWIISATVPQYYFSHLLMSSVEHFPTHLIFLESKNFLSLMNFLRIINHPDIKLIFNGNAGSEVSHAHVHLTYQKFEIIDYINELELNDSLRHIQGIKVKSADNNFVDFDVYYQAIKVKVLVSKDPKILFKNLDLYFSNYILSGVDKSYNLGAQMYLNNGYFYTILIASAKDKTLSNDATILPQAFTVILPFRDFKIDEINEKEIKKKYNKLDYLNTLAMNRSFQFFEYVYNLSRPISQSIQEQGQEVASYLLSKENCESIEKILKEVEKTKFFETCVARNCPVYEFSKYKILLSWYIICTKLQMLDNTMIRDIINGEFLNMTKFDIKSFDKLYFKGPLSQIIFEKTFTDLIIVSNKNDLNPGLTNTNINNWLNFETNRSVIGEPSENGYVVKSSAFKNNSKYPIVIKINKKYQNLELFNQEFIFGILLNSVRQKIPNFVITLGAFKCFSHMTDDGKILDLTDASLCSNKQGDLPFSYILLENIEGISLKENIRKCLSTDVDLFLAIKQISLALWFASEEIEFTHYDLHILNILVTSLSEKCKFVYKINLDTVEVVAKNVYTIIDYGSSHVRAPKNYTYKTGNLGMYNVHPEKKNIYFDIYRLITSLFENICIYNFDLFSFDSIKLFFGSIFKQYYSNLFKEGYMITIKSIMNNKSNANRVSQIMNSIRKDNSLKDSPWFWMILLDGDIDYNVRMLTYKNLISNIDMYLVPSTEDLPTYFWGNYPENEIGKYIKPENTLQIQKDRIQRLQQQFENV